jgi:hypothetical protein
MGLPNKIFRSVEGAAGAVMTAGSGYFGLQDAADTFNAHPDGNLGTYLRDVWNAGWEIMVRHGNFAEITDQQLTAARSAGYLGVGLSVGITLVANAWNKFK